MLWKAAEIINNLRQDEWPADRDLSPETPKYKSEALTACSVK